MTNCNADSANDTAHTNIAESEQSLAEVKKELTNLTADTPEANTGLRTLYEHLEDMQQRALNIQGLTEALALIVDEGISTEAAGVLAHMAEKNAKDLNLGLDSVNLPEVSI